ncbi:MAG: arsenic resistance N-acetyltransferase ArsN2 [Candidatus Thorarchaeota archaeon]
MYEVQGMIEELLVNQASSDDLSGIEFLLKEAQLPIEGIEPHIDDFIVVTSPEVALGPEVIIGCVGLEVYRESALLRSLAVHPDLRKNGLGSRLVDLATGNAKRKGVEILYLLTDTAEDFFKRRGFSWIDRSKVPEELQQSIEFTKLCPDAPCLMKQI